MRPVARSGIAAGRREHRHHVTAPGQKPHNSGRLVCCDRRDCEADRTGISGPQQLRAVVALAGRAPDPGGYRVTPILGSAPTERLLATPHRHGLAQLLDDDRQHRLPRTTTKPRPAPGGRGGSRAEESRAPGRRTASVFSPSARRRPALRSSTSTACAHGGVPPGDHAPLLLAARSCGPAPTLWATRPAPARSLPPRRSWNA